MKQLLILLTMLAVLTTSVCAQDGELHGFLIGASASLSNDGSAMTIKDNISPQVSAIVQLGSTGNTYYLPGLTWRTNNGWLQFDALSIFTEVAKFKFGSVFAGGNMSPFTLSTADGVKREDVGSGAIDLGLVVPLNKKYDKLYLALALKYNAFVYYNEGVPEEDRLVNSITLTAAIIGLNPFK